MVSLVVRKRDYKKFPRTAEWLTAEERRKKFIKWLDSALELEGNWLKDERLGLELRIELYLEWLSRKGLANSAVIKEGEKLRAYINRFAD